MLLGEKRELVSRITQALFHLIVDELSELNDVHLDGLGNLHPYVMSGRRASRAVLTKGTWGKKPTEENMIVRVERKYYVAFKKAPGLTQAIGVRQKPGGKTVKVMEKLGVDEQQAENEKRAQHGCPLCGQKVERHGNILACPTHGTEPFENKKQ